MSRAALNRFGWILLASYLLAGIVYSGLLPAIHRFPDEREYLALGHNLAFGPGFSLDGVHPTAQRPPGFPFFLAMIERVGGGYFACRVAQFLFMAGTVVLTDRLIGRPTGGILIATCLVALYPVLFYVSGTIFPQPFACFLFILGLLLVQVKNRNSFTDVCAGLVLGLLVLAVPMFLLTVFVVLGGACYFAVITPRRAALIGSVALLCVGLWTARNAIVFHRFVPISSNSGMNLLMGNNPKALATQTVDNPGVIPYYNESVDMKLDEFQSDRLYSQAATNWIKSHPGDALLLYLKKVLNYFNVENVYASQSSSETAIWKQVALAAGYLLLVAMTLWRIAEIRQYPLQSQEKLYLAIYVMSAFTMAVFITRIRYRLPYDFLLIAMSSFHLSRKLDQWLKTNSNGRSLPISRPQRSNVG
jgi:hypothetical protein